jgi:hypothetical protein
MAVRKRPDLRGRRRPFNHETHGLLGFFPREIFGRFLTLSDFGEQMLHGSLVTFSDVRVTMMLFVQPALGLAEILPPARTRIVARKDRRGTVGAADAGVIAVVEPVIRALRGAGGTSRPAHWSSGPEGLNFDQLELFIPLDQSGVGSRGSLIPPNSCNPGRVFAKNTSERFDFPELAALVRLAGPQLVAILAGLLFRRQQGFHLDDLRWLQPVPRDNPITHVEGFGKQKIRIQIKERRLRIDAMHHIHQATSSAPKLQANTIRCRYVFSAYVNTSHGCLSSNESLSAFSSASEGRSADFCVSFTLLTPRPFPQEF